MSGTENKPKWKPNSPHPNHKRRSYHNTAHKNILSVDLNDADGIRDDAHGWRVKLLKLTRERKNELKEQFKKTRGRTGGDKGIEADPAERKRIERLYRYWAKGREQLLELHPEKSLVDALMVMVIGYSINGLDQTDRVSSQQARLTALKKEFYRLHYKLDKVEDGINDIEKELYDSGDKMIDRFKNCLRYTSSMFTMFSEDSDESMV